MGGEDSDKIVRDSGDTLTIKLTEDEEKYRAKYLPDPRNLTDEKLVCTVCSVSLANDIHRGKTVHVHRALKVLVCEACFTFYGDGCFSTDEDGDDKYCRWCGQGGTLFLCSACNCAFCQKCVKQNLKASVLADLESDDWKCYFCNPRPLFGCRTICWGALELNKIGMGKEKEKLRKQRERLEKMEERKREESQKLKKKNSSEEDEQSTKKRKSRAKTSSSPEVMPTKKTRSSIGSGHMNGSIDRGKKKRRDSSSDDESSDSKTVTNKSRSRSVKTKSYAESTSEDESSMKSKSKLKKKKSRNSSSESSEENRKISRRKSTKKKTDTSDDESYDEKPVKRRRPSRRKKNESNSSSDNKPKKKRSRKKQKDTSTDEESDEDRNKKRVKGKKTKSKESSCEYSDSEAKKDKKKASESRKRNEESDNESKQNLEKYINDDKIEIKLKTNEDSVDNALMKKRIKLAVLWLSATVKDIAELGTLISIRASKFGKKKINSENLKTYDDVLTAVSKLKQLISGIHSNYDHIEKSLDGHLKPWKILTGLEEEPETEKPVAVEECNTVTSKVIDKEEVPTVEPSDKDKNDSLNNSTIVESNNSEAEKTHENEDMVFQWSGLSADEDSGDEKESTKALISKANETLNKEDEKADKTVGEVSKTGDDMLNKSTTSDNQEMSQNTINDSHLSQSLLSEAGEQDDAENMEKTCDEDPSETSQEDVQKTEGNINSNEEKQQDNGSDTDVQKTEDNKNSNGEKQQDNGSDTDMFDNKESSSVETNIDSPEKKFNKEERIDTSPDGTPLKRKSELKVIKTARRKILNLTQEFSSDDALDSFNKKLKDRWQQEKSMKLKTSLGIDSSGESDIEVEVKKNDEKNVQENNESKETDLMKEKKLNNEDKHKDKNKRERHIKQSQDELQRKEESCREKVNKTLKHSKEINKGRKITLTSDDSECEDIQKDKHNVQNKVKNNDSTTKLDKQESNKKGQNSKIEDKPSKSNNTKEDKKNKIRDKRKNSEDEEKKEDKNSKYKEKETPTEKVSGKNTKDKKQHGREKESKKKTLSSDDSEIDDIPKNHQESKKTDKIKKEHSKKFKNVDIKEINKDRKSTLTSDDSECEDIQKDKHNVQNKVKNNDSTTKSGKQESNKKGQNSKIEDKPSKSNNTKEDKKIKIRDKRKNSEDEEKKEDVNSKYKEKETPTEKVSGKNTKDKKQYGREKESKKKTLSSDDSEIDDIPKNLQESKKTDKIKKEHYKKLKNVDSKDKKNENITEKSKKGDHDKKKGKEENRKYKTESKAKKANLSIDDSAVEDIPKDKPKSKETEMFTKKCELKLKKLKNDDHDKKIKLKEETNKCKTEKDDKNSVLSSDESEVEKIPKDKQEPKKGENKTLSDDSENEDILKDKPKSKETEMFTKKCEIKLKKLKNDDHDKKIKLKEETNECKTEKDDKNTVLSSDESEVENIQKDKQESKKGGNKTLSDDSENEDIQKDQPEPKETLKLKIKYNKIVKNDDIDQKNKKKNKNTIEKLKNEDHDKTHKRREDKKIINQENESKVKMLSSDDSEIEDIKEGELKSENMTKGNKLKKENDDTDSNKSKNKEQSTNEISNNVLSKKINKVKEVKKKTKEDEDRKDTSGDSESESIQSQEGNINQSKKNNESSLTKNKTTEIMNKTNKKDRSSLQSNDSTEKKDNIKDKMTCAEEEETENNLGGRYESNGALEVEELIKQKGCSDDEVEDSLVQNEKHEISLKTNNSIAEEVQEENTSKVQKESDPEIVEESMVVCPEISSIRTKFVGLSSSSEEEIIEVNKKKTTLSSSDEKNKTVEKNKTKEKSRKTRSELNQKRSINLVCLDSSDEEDILAASPGKKGSVKEEIDKDDKKKSDRSSSPFNLSSADSSDSEIIISRKRKKKSSSDSDFSATLEEKSKKNTKKRKRIKMADSSEEESDEDNVKSKKRKSSVGESPGKGGGRKNIKKIKGKDDLEEATKEAAEEEKERRRRVEERQKLFNQVFEVKEAHVLDKLVLDFDPKEKKELLSVNKTLVSKMKPHQAKGVKFMWDSCFESLSDIKKTKGSGCILAHCMGLGKTFQVISLAHTLLTNEEETGVHTIMVVCPLSTVLNWYNEFDKWLQDVENGSDIEVFHLTKCKQNPERARELRRWQHNGGVLIMGYEMFRNLAAENNKKFRAKMKKDFQETLVDPGADLIVCDEGHMLKNEQTALSKAMNRVKTLRRIVLTGTPMQNNLNEYHCMVQFVKPNLLGTRREFLNRFVNPISNGQFVDSTDGDVKIMKRRAHVLHKMLEGLVQRFDYNVLTPFLPPKQEYVVSVCLSDLQIKLYQHYLQHYSQQSENNKGGARLFQDWQALGRIWTHPRVLKMSSDKANWLREKKAMEESDSEGSLREFIDDNSEAETTPDESDISNYASDESVDGGKKNSKIRHKANTRSTRSNPKNIALLESSEDENEKKEEETTEAASNEGEWWSEFIEPHHFEDMNHSGKLVMLFGILKESEMIEDKVLVFSQSLFSLDLIEYFLNKIDDATQEGRMDETLCNHQGNWSKGLDYFRLDGSTSSENRSIWCKSFNREDNPRARLFLISTRAGGLGINLTAANRVIIFDASWNPSHDVQSIFRIYRFGQKKPCYVYRFIAHGTMEEKVYDRQVAKQSISNRVVDEQQVHRHFSSNDLNELYSFTPPTKKEDRPIPALPRDVLFAEILKQFSDWIEKYHEHDSLLENVIEEELNEEERKLAWEDYENDKKRGFMPANTNTGGTVNPMSYHIEYLRQQLKAQYPQKSEQELNQMLVYQVSELMRRQQQLAMQQMQQQNLGMAGNVRMPMAQSSMTPFGMQQRLPQQNAITDYQKQMQAQYQLRQMQLQQQQQNALRAQQSMLKTQLSQPSTTNRVGPTTMPQFALERMMQNYQASNPKSSPKTSNNPSNPPS